MSKGLITVIQRLYIAKFFVSYSVSVFFSHLQTKQREGLSEIAKSMLRIRTENDILKFLFFHHLQCYQHQKKSIRFLCNEM